MFICIRVVTISSTVCECIFPSGSVFFLLEELSLVFLAVQDLLVMHFHFHVSDKVFER